MQMTPPERLLTLSAAFGAAFALALPQPAVACGNEFHRVHDRHVPKLDRADRLLVAGRPVGALRLAAAAGRSMGGDAWVKARASEPAGAAQLVRQRDASHLVVRAAFTAAVATVRLDGKVTLPRGRRAPGLGEAERVANLRWAAEVLEAQAKADATPRNEARLAEARAALPDGEQTALELLTRLEQADVMPDAHAYALLARLRHARGERQARDEAVATCRQRAGRLRARLCPRFERPAAAPSPPPAPTPTDDEPAPTS